MRWLSLVLCTLLLLSACGRKKVQVQTPAPASPASIPSSDLQGLASYYAEPYHGRKTASGEIFDSYQELTAAHRTLPFNTMVRVTNKTNGRQVDVRINDRGPFVDGRVIDLSLRAARVIDLVQAGVAPVRLTVLKTAAAPLATAAAPGAFAVQVAAFESQKTAEDLKGRLEKKYPTVMVQVFTQEKTFYRVRIGEPNIESANKTAAELRKSAFKPFVVRVN